MSNYTAILTKQGEMVLATCPELAFIVSGRTEKEALTNLYEQSSLRLHEARRAPYGYKIGEDQFDVIDQRD